MESERCVRDRMTLALLVFGSVAAVVARPGVEGETGRDLDCTNDFAASVSCHFGAQNCAEYSVTVRSNDAPEESHCVFNRSDRGQCGCSVPMTTILGESYTATLRKGNKSMEPRVFTILDSIKPKTPTIVSVSESNGNFPILWSTNMEDHIRDDLTANVTYRKKGEEQKVTVSIKPSIVNGLNYYEILGQHLEPSTTYLVSVRSYMTLNGRFSDSSPEWEFTTPESQNVILLAVIISLSFAAVIFSAVTYGCYVKLKKIWWDSVAKCPNPKLIIHASEQEVLKPMPPTISSICVEPLIPDDSKPWSKVSLKDTSSGSLQQSSGISTGSSCLSYANTEPADIIAGVQDALCKAFANISPVSPLNTNLLTKLNKDSGFVSAPNNHFGVRADDMSSGSSGFDNKTYSILIPSCPREFATNSSEVQKQAEMLCVSAYHPSEGDIVFADQQAPTGPLVNLPPLGSSPMPTDMSYQQCSAEDSSLSSSSSGANTVASCDPVSRVEAGCESGGATVPDGATEGVTVCDENPCYGCVPGRSQGLPPVEDDYQPFQNLVEQPDILFSENKGIGKEKPLNKYPEESFAKMPPSLCSPVVLGFINNVQGGECLSTLQTHFLPLTSADQSMPVLTDSGYQSV